MRLSTPSSSRLRPSLRSGWLIAAVLLAIALCTFVARVHSFLAINRPVDAEIMVVEGWVPDNVLKAAAVEIKTGHYSQIFVSGLIFEKDHPKYGYLSGSARAAQSLIASGVPSTMVDQCPAPAPRFNRTSHMARAVRDRILSLKLTPRGINVVTLGPHARETLVAYRRMLGKITAVGVVTYPLGDYDPDHWWTSGVGIKKTTKDFAGWLKEVLVGLRS